MFWPVAFVWVKFRIATFIDDGNGKMRRKNEYNRSELCVVKMASKKEIREWLIVKMKQILLDGFVDWVKRETTEQKRKYYTA